MTEDEMVGWYHQLDGHEFEQALGVGDGQGSLVSCSPWGEKELANHTSILVWKIRWMEEPGRLQAYVGHKLFMGVKMNLH